MQQNKLKLMVIYVFHIFNINSCARKLDFSSFQLPSFNLTILYKVDSYICQSVLVLNQESVNNALPIGNLLSSVDSDHIKYISYNINVELY